MAVRGLEQTKTRLDQAKRLGGVVLAAIVVAALVIGVLILSGLIGFVPAPKVTVLGFVVPSNWTAFAGAFTLSLTLIIGYVYFAALVKSSVEKTVDVWLGLPDWLQALVLGVQAGLVAGLSIVLTGQFLYSFELPVILGVGAVVAVLVTAVTIRLRNRGWTLREWTQSLYTSILVGGVVAALATFAFAGVVPGYTPPVVFLVSWGVCLYLLFRRRHAVGDSPISRLLTRTGYAQMRQVETIPVSVGTGLALALIVAALVGVAGTTPDSAAQRTGLSILLVWPVVTLATSLGWPSRERTDLVFEDINVRDSTGRREITIRNLGDRPVTLRNAKITDANNRLYQINIDVSLGAGEAARFEIPEIFELAAHDRYEVFDLPFGLVLTREASEPMITTRAGRQYKLLWLDQLQDASQDAARGEPAHA